MQKSMKKKKKKKEKKEKKRKKKRASVDKIYRSNTRLNGVFQHARCRFLEICRVAQISRVQRNCLNYAIRSTSIEIRGLFRKKKRDRLAMREVLSLDALSGIWGGGGGTLFLFLDARVADLTRIFIREVRLGRISPSFHSVYLSQFYTF